LYTLEANLGYVLKFQGRRIVQMNIIRRYGVDEEVSPADLNSLKGLKLLIDCKSWPEDIAAELFGENWQGKKTEGFIVNAKGKAAGDLKFSIRIPELDEVYKGYGWDYVINYSQEDDLPLQFHGILKHFLDLALAKDTGDTMEKDASDINNNIKKRKSNQSVEKEPSVKPAQVKKVPAHMTKGFKRKSEIPANVYDKPLITDSIESECEEQDIDMDDTSDVEDEDDMVKVVDPDPTEELLYRIDGSGWTKDAPPDFSGHVPFDAPTGPNHNLPDNATPLDYFTLFICIDLFSVWASYTNAYAAAIISQLKGKCRSYAPTNGAEIKAFIACIIWMSLIKSMPINEFWDPRFSPAKVRFWFPGIIRFQQLKRFFKVSDVNDDRLNPEDRLAKVRSLFEDFLKRCRQFFMAFQQLSLDEAIKKFKGRCIFKQYIKSKPVRWGIKIYCLCCALTGYLLHAAFYLGKCLDSDHEPYQDRSETHMQLMTLFMPFQGKNHIVHMDNWFTSITFASDLKKKGFLIAGTVRSNRKGLDKRIIMQASEYSALKKNPGIMRYSSQHDLCLLSWFDKRAVLMLSNAYLPVGNDEITHWYNAKAGEIGATPSGKIQRTIPIPPIIVNYRRYLGGVDLLDQYRSYYKLELRSLKYWHPMFFFILETAIINAWVLYRETMSKRKLPLQFTLREFRMQLALGLAKEWEEMGCTLGVDNTIPQTPTKKFKAAVAQVRVHLRGKDIFTEQQVESSTQHDSFMAKIPEKEGTKKKIFVSKEGKWCFKNHRAMVCRYCADFLKMKAPKRTSFWCKKCEKPLCKSPCFHLWHVAMCNERQKEIK
jgi:hypothetical protein